MEVVQVTLEVTKSSIELIAKQIMRQMCKALSYLHEEAQVCHRDIKPDNLILASLDPVVVKILDFNVARKMVEGQRMITKTGLEEWSAPEMLNGIPYTEKVDMWSAGCVFYYMLLGTKPYKSKTTEKLHRRISTGEFKLKDADILSKDAQDLLRKLMTVDDSQRLSAEQALQHEFLRESKSFSDMDLVGKLKYS